MTLLPQGNPCHGSVQRFNFTSGSCAGGNGLSDDGSGGTGGGGGGSDDFGFGFGAFLAQLHDSKERPGQGLQTVLSAAIHPMHIGLGFFLFAPPPPALQLCPAPPSPLTAHGAVLIAAHTAKASRPETCDRRVISVSSRQRMLVQRACPQNEALALPRKLTGKLVHLSGVPEERPWGVL